ncbi:transcriptional regulator [Longimycelium tulufanense]|uniref:Transcriptional regulator n=1 Tax=Longimycelium tulufanense TaxID=907463 RepID=A0A8J3CAK3_9PSEU|nr:helix-turn-helix transcriptional regulator [Longimycelium tulufanense]GGM65513.1 transcriptional regulator [Longimycelium tulufanense]
MAHGRPTVERRQLGLVLRRLRDERRVTQQQAADAIGRTPGRISHIEAGRGSLSPEELSTLLGLYEVADSERETLLMLGAVSRKRRRVGRAYADQLPESYRRLADFQADATSISFYENGLIPGLIQSTSYLEAVIRGGEGIWWERSSAETQRRISFRLEQQRRVLQALPRKQLHFVFTEDALHNVFGSPMVMQGQMIHLIQLMENNEGLILQIVPTGSLDNPALSGGFLLLDFEAAPSIGFASVLAGPAIYFDQTEDVEPMKRVFHRVTELALSPADSKSLLVKILEEGPR